MSFRAVNVDSSMPYWRAFSYVKSRIGPAVIACFFLYSGVSGLSSGRICPGCVCGGGAAAIAALRFAASAADKPFAVCEGTAPPFMVGMTGFGFAFGVS